MCLHMSMETHYLCESGSVSAGVYACISMCVGACMCEFVAAECVGIATLIYSSVMGHYASCIVYEEVPEFQTDP